MADGLYIGLERRGRPCGTITSRQTRRSLGKIRKEPVEISSLNRDLPHQVKKKDGV